MILFKQCWVRVYLAAACSLVLAPFLMAGSSRPTWDKETDPRRQAPSQQDASREDLQARVAYLEAQNQAVLEELRTLREQFRTFQTKAKTPAATGTDLASAAVAAKPSAIPVTPGTPSSQAPDPPVLQTEGNHSQLSFYGFVRVDALIDDSRANHFHFPTFVLPEDPSTGLNNNSNFAFHPRLTRIGMNYFGGVLDGLGGATISGKIETDFQNGGKESRAIARYRHAYMNLSWRDSSLLIGQTWDTISPLYPTVNSDSMMWNAGNLGDRRMQVRYAYEPDSGLSLRAALGLSGAVDPQDLDADGIRDGEASTLPHLQARLGYRSQQANLGLWSHWGQEETDLFFSGERDFNSYSVGFDYDFKINSIVGLKGELWRGRNLNDFRGGIGQGINVQTRRGISSRGGWVELGLRAPKIYSFSAGFTLDDPENGDLISGGRTENRVWYVTHQFRLAAPFLLGLDYLRWRTDYKNLDTGTDNRVNAYFIYNF